MTLTNKWPQTNKKRNIALILSLLGIISPFPLAGLHKLYLGQPLWGLVYFLLWSTPIPRIATVIDLVWYFVQTPEQFDCCFNHQVPTQYTHNSPQINSHQVKAISLAFRELDQLREDGLISEGEFEQKRRQLLERL